MIESNEFINQCINQIIMIKYLNHDELLLEIFLLLSDQLKAQMQACIFIFTIYLIDFLSFGRKFIINFYNFIQMGNLIKDSLILYALQWTPIKNHNDFKLVQRQTEIPFPIQGKILIPISKASSRLQFILQNHHNTILLQDSECGNQLIKIPLRGIPIANQYHLCDQSSICQSQCFDDRLCPFPLVLERFHQSYVKNYINSFRFYGISVMAFNSIEDYLKSQCKKQYLICSNYELDQLSFKLPNYRANRSQQGKKLSILCFCNKQQYSISQRIESFLKKENMEVSLFENILDIIEKINNQRLFTPPQMLIRTEKILFYLSQKEKQVNYYQKMGRRIQKSIRNTVVENIQNKKILISKLQQTNYSILIISNDHKEIKANFELYQQLQQQGLQDRVIIVRRENELSEKVTQRIYNIVQKPKYKKILIQQKNLICYGNQDFFKYTLKHFPNLKFKLFIDIHKQKDKINKYLVIPSQVIVTNQKICSCNPQYCEIAIKSQIIILQIKASTKKELQYKQNKNCTHQKSFMDEEQLLQFYRSHPQKFFLGLNFNYQNKKLSHIGKIINDIFLKLKQKKSILYNSLNQSIFLFYSQYYTIDQISSHIMKLLSTRQFGNYEKQYYLDHIKKNLYEQLFFLAINKRIQQQIIKACDIVQATDVFQLGQILLGYMARYQMFYQEINSIWALFLYQDRKQHQNNMKHILFLLFLAFSKTNFIKYSNQTLQHLTLVIKNKNVNFDRESFTQFKSKNRNNFAYNVEFLACEIYQETDKIDSDDIRIKIQGNQLTTFSLFIPLWKKGKKVIICPLSKFQILTKSNTNQYLLKLSVNSQHKLLDKFSQNFLQQNQHQIKLLDEDRQMRKFDVFLDSMAHSKYQTAGYILKKIMKDQNMCNQNCLNALSILYHLKRNQMQIAESKLRNDNYHEILSRVIKTLKEGQGFNSEDRALIPETFSSNKRIEENNKEYQNMEETSNQNQSIAGSGFAHTDPEMMRQISADGRLVDPKHTKGRSPSQMLRNSKLAKLNKIPIFNRKLKAEPSISDAMSETSKGSAQDKKMNIVILPPMKKKCSENIEDNQNTFGNRFYTNYTCLNSDKSGSQKQQFNNITKLKTTKSEADYKSQYTDRVVESGLFIKKKSSFACKQIYHIEKQQNEEPTSEVLIDCSESNEEENEKYGQTGKFNFATFSSTNQEKFFTKNQQSKLQKESQIQEISQQIQVSSNNSIQQLNNNEQNSHRQMNRHLTTPNNSNPIPLKKKRLFKFERQSLNKLSQKDSNIHSPLINIQEERSSQLSLSNSTANFLLSPTQKENIEFARPKQGKLFTFFKNNQIKPRFSLSSNKNSLNLSGSALEKIQEKKQPLFYQLQDQQKIKDEFPDINSISSIQIEEESVYPEQLIITKK